MSGAASVAALRAMAAAIEALPDGSEREAALLLIVDRSFTDDAVQHYTGSHGCDRRGKAEIYMSLSATLRSYSGIKMTEVISAAESGQPGVGTVLFTFSATNTGPMLAGMLPPSGRPVSVPVFEVARTVADGRIVESWSSLDKFMALAQVGLFDVLKSQFPQLEVPKGTEASK